MTEQRIRRRAPLRHAPRDLRLRIYTMSDVGCDLPDYLGLASLGVPIPCYGEMRMYAPRLRAFRRQLRNDGVALIHVTTPGPVGLAAKYLASRLRLPTIGSFHTHLADYTTILSGSARLGRLIDQYMRWLYGACETLLVPSNDTREQLEGAGWRTDRMAVWSRGVDTDAFSPARRSAALREKWRVCDRRPAILYAGRLSTEKGLSLLPCRGSVRGQESWHGNGADGSARPYRPRRRRPASSRVLRATGTGSRACSVRCAGPRSASRPTCRPVSTWRGGRW